MRQHEQENFERVAESLVKSQVDYSKMSYITIAINDISLKPKLFGQHFFVADCTGPSSTTLT